MAARSECALIYCAGPYTGLPDPNYQGEITAAVGCGFDYDLIDFEALVDDRDAATAVSLLEPRARRTAVYRGWMLSRENYAALYEALSARGLVLINDPDQYSHCHFFPNSYDVIRDHTPPSVWLPVEGAVDFDRVYDLLNPFGDRPIIVKDYVKSEKHYWAEACFIPRASDRAAVERVVGRFLELLAGQPQGGLVFREFVEIVPIGDHSQSRMPLSCEYRLVFLDGEMIYAAPYWGNKGYASHPAPPDGLFGDVARRVKSRLFTMDVALRQDGHWMIIELGDGQVFRLEDDAQLRGLYAALGARLLSRQETYHG